MSILMPMPLSSGRRGCSVAVLLLVGCFFLGAFLFDDARRTTLQLQTPISFYRYLFASPFPTLPSSASSIIDPSTPAFDPAPASRNDEALLTGASNASLSGAAPEFQPDDSVTLLPKTSCDVFRGTWVRDDQYPIYQPGSCPYVDEAFDCQTNGRPDSAYLRWRWKPDDCDLPRCVLFRIRKLLPYFL